VKAPGKPAGLQLGDAFAAQPGMRGWFEYATTRRSYLPSVRWGVRLTEVASLPPSLSVRSSRPTQCFNRIEAMLIDGDGHAELVVDAFYTHNLPMAVEANRASRIGVFQDY
jgi:hypothetical protein